MATHQTRPPPPTTTDDEDQETLLREEIDDGVSSNGCGCFRQLGLGNYGGGGGGEEWWAVRKMKKLKEVSEMVAGPRWKNLIRKIGGYLKGKKQRNNKYQYDPQSYALNFDEEDDDCPPIGFSSRFAVPLASREQRS